MEIFVHGKDKSWNLGISAAKKEFDIWFQQANFGDLSDLCSQLTHCCEVLKWCFLSSILHPVWGWWFLSCLKLERGNLLSLLQIIPQRFHWFHWFPILGEKDKQWQHALFLFYTTLKRSPRSPGTLDVISVNAAISCWALVSCISYFP